MVRAQISPFNVWVIAVSHDLAGLIDPKGDGRFYWQRESLLAGYRLDGLPLPDLTFKVDPVLRKSSYRITANGKNVGNGELREGCLLASGPQRLLDRLPGIPTRSSLAAAAGLGLLGGHLNLARPETHGVPLLWERWIARADRDQAEACGCRTRDPIYDLQTQLSHAYSQLREELLSEGIVTTMLDQQQRKTPSLVTMVRHCHSASRLVRSFRGLLRCDIPLDDLPKVLAALLDLGPQHSRLPALRALEFQSFLDGRQDTAHPLTALQRLTVSRPGADGGPGSATNPAPIRAIQLSPELEEALVETFDPDDGLMNPRLANLPYLGAVASFAADLPPDPKPTVLLVPEMVRYGLEGEGCRVLESLEVVAPSDIPRRTITFCGHVARPPGLPAEPLSGSEPELRLEPLELELGRGWQSRRQSLLFAADRLRETLAGQGLALPEVVAQADNLLPHDTLVVSLRHDECSRLSSADIERDHDKLLASIVEGHIGSLISPSAISDFLAAAANRWPNKVASIKECYTTEELRRLYLALFREGISCRYQSGIIDLLSRSKDNLYALVERIRALEAPIAPEAERHQQTWRVEVGSELRGIIGRLGRQLEWLYALYRQDGLPLPKVDFAVSQDVGSRCYRVHLGTRTLLHGELREGLLIATPPDGRETWQVELPGERSMMQAVVQLGWAAGQRRETHTHPPGYLPVRWIKPEDRPTYEAQGWRVRDPLFDFGAGLYAAYCMAFQDVLSPELLDLALLQASEVEPGLRRDVLAWHSPRAVTAAVSGLLQARISISSLTDVFLALRSCRHPARHEAEIQKGALERSLRRRRSETESMGVSKMGPPQPTTPTNLDGWYPVFLGSQTQAELAQAAILENQIRGFGVMAELEATLLEILADQPGQIKGVLLHLPEALHTPVLDFCAEQLSGLLKMAERPPEKPQASTTEWLAWLPRPPGFYDEKPAVQLRAETVAIELGRAWHAQCDDVEDALLGCFACRIQPELGIDVGKQVISVSAHLPVDGVCFRIGGQELSFLKPPALGVELLELAPLGAFRGPVVRLPALELEARLKEPELSESAQKSRDPEGWTALMFFLIEDFLKGHLEQLVTRASLAALLKSAQTAWPYITEVVRSRWSLEQIREVYIELLRRKICVDDHRTILRALARAATPAELARGEDTWEKALERVRQALSAGFVPHLAVEGLLRVITLDDRLCAALREGLIDGSPATLSARAVGQLGELLERYGRDVHFHSVILAPPDLRRAIELSLANRVRCPVLSLTEVPADTEMALEVCLTL